MAYTVNAMILLTNPNLKDSHGCLQSCCERPTQAANCMVLREKVPKQGIKVVKLAFCKTNQHW